MKQKNVFVFFMIYIIAFYGMMSTQIEDINPQNPDIPPETQILIMPTFILVTVALIKLTGSLHRPPDGQYGEQTEPAP